MYGELNSTPKLAESSRAHNISSYLFYCKFFLKFSLAVTFQKQKPKNIYPFLSCIVVVEGAWFVSLMQLDEEVTHLPIQEVQEG